MRNKIPGRIQQQFAVDICGVGNRGIFLPFILSRFMLPRHDDHFEFIEYLVANQHKVIELSIVSEAIDLENLGVYKLLDLFEFEQVGRAVAYDGAYLWSLNA